MFAGVTGLFRIYEYIQVCTEYMLAYLHVEYIGNIPYLHKGRHMDAHDGSAFRLALV